MDTNSCYGVDQEELFTTAKNHKITSVKDDKLGEYLVEELGYQPNKNLFAFNYPNGDMVAMNAKRLSQYINGLIDAASKGGKDTADFVDPRYLFDPETNEAKFILIGHSMGGLVSRYYIENINDQYVEKLITICTPHYGSGFSTAADLLDVFGQFLPCDVDLQKDSMLFTGEKNNDFFLTNPLIDETKEEYARLHQSPPLKGNANTKVKYYAIAGYDATTHNALTGEPNYPYMEKVSGKMLQGLSRYDLSFAVDFDINTKSKSAFQKCINEEINQWSLEYYKDPSEFLFEDIDGDNVVNYMSQLAVKFDAYGNTVSHQIIENATLVIASGYNIVKRLHSHIAALSPMHYAVEKYIRADVAQTPQNGTQIKFEADKWTMMDAQYDERND
ncbi:MAG: alpha/beta fold hydrolase, partial [Clostridia bacterium]|nr:alpha/beta fold hydrolase [Clostridia bacterium]